MKKTKAQKGITLIALIITIIVLLILAVVSIRAIQGDGIIAKARQAAAAYNQAQINEIEKMSELKALIAAHTGNGEESTETGDISEEVNISEAGVVLSTTETTNVKDVKGNIIRVPAGFKILNTNDTVDKGIVIEDVSAGNAGSQFVWVPVGTITKADGTPETIELNRYTFANDGTAIPQGNAVIDAYYQELVTSTYGNTTAKDIEGFKTSVATNEGYYIGRYEASESGETIACKSNQTVYVDIEQPDAASKSRAMYENKTFTSDLVNSYAWDTAIVFIQKCSTGEDANKYSRVNKSSTRFGKTGVNNDEYCNINDMSGNAYEWTTETFSNGSGSPCVFRSGILLDGFGHDASDYPVGHSAYRCTLSEDAVGGYIFSFRSILYL